jgi:FkbM family methyltransferase
MNLKKYLRRNSTTRAFRDFLIGFSNVNDTPYKSIVKRIRELEVSTVIDIGANVGQFGIDLRRSGFKGKIVSYEPVKEIFSDLRITSSKYQPWEVVQIALGEVESEDYINVSANSGLSSSILKISKLHLENFPSSRTIFREKVLISTVDHQLSKLDLSPDSVMLKLDVQGFESRVLKGANKSLSKIPLCFLEVSLTPLYENELPLLPILNLLHESEHEVIEIFRGVKSKNGELLQLDILTKLSSR